MFRRKLGKKGQAVAEYAILLALIVIIAYLAIRSLGIGVSAKADQAAYMLSQ